MILATVSGVNALPFVFLVDAHVTQPDVVVNLEDDDAASATDDISDGEWRECTKKWPTVSSLFREVVCALNI